MVQLQSAVGSRRMDWAEQHWTREKSCTDPRFCSKHAHLWQGIFTSSNRLANCSKPKSGTSHSVFFLSQHLGLLTSSAAKHPEILAIRYQLNLMDLARKLKTRRQHRGQPCTNNTYNISRESRMTSSRLHGQRTFRPNLMTSVELVSLVCSALTMHRNCGQYQQEAADFNP